MQSYVVLRDYILLMHEQRESLFTQLEGMPEALFWQRPAPGEWSIGEILDHLRLLYRTTMPLFRFSWWLMRPWAWLRRGRPFRVTLGDVYRKPDFPHQVGWLWSPRHTPERPIPRQAAQNNLRRTHDAVEAFYRGKSPALLGQVGLYDPIIGWMNLISGLRVALYHDQLHYEQILATATAIGWALSAPSVADTPAPQRERARDRRLSQRVGNVTTPWKRTAGRRPLNGAAS